ncbi:Uma2 family endonuclease [Nocardia sp. NPDC050710]|uniref:Uma2 family endonuclease n=1 Tax=Nocardia sp. NPDC050710 TaxID=3157220 RepID=UPI0033C521CD
MPTSWSGRWTAADLDHLPENGLRYEVLNGQLVVNAIPNPRHQWVIQQLERSIDEVVPPGYAVVQGVGLLIGDDEPIPDLVVMSGPMPWEARGIPAEQVKLAVEVVSKSTTLQDRMVKPVLYAEAGIPNYWRFEINPFKGQLPGESLPVLFAHALGDHQTYELTHRVVAGEVAILHSPFEFTVDPADLLP